MLRNESSRKDKVFGTGVCRWAGQRQLKKGVIIYDRGGPVQIRGGHKFQCKEIERGGQN